MAAKKVSNSAKAHVSITAKHGKERGKESAENMSVMLEEDVGEDPVVLVYHRSETYNLGNYESRKVEVGIHVPCSKNNKAVEKAWRFAEEWVDERLTTTADRLDKQG